MRKRILCILLVLCMIPAVSALAADFHDTEDSGYRDEILDIAALGIVTGYEDGFFKSDNLLTRAEFCQLMIRLNGIDENTVSSDKQYYYDVPQTYWAFGAIGYMTAQGWISGGTDGNFNPDRPIAYSEAVKIVINFLGYKYRADIAGGYPGGYYSIALELGILKGITGVNFDVSINRGEICKLLHNTLTVPLVIMTGLGENTIYEISKDKTVLSEYLKCEKKTGVVEANEYYGMSDSLAAEDCILISGVSYRCSAGDKNRVGEKITFFYRIDGDEAYPPIVRISKSESSDLTVRLDQNPSYQNLELTYDLNRDKTAKAKISPYIKLFYNGKLTDFKGEYIENLENGTIRLLSSEDNSVYDIMFINSYETMVVGLVNSIKEQVKSNDYKTTLDFSKSIDYLLKDSEGNELTFTDIKEGMVLSWYENDLYLEGHLSSSVLNGVIGEKNTDGDRLSLTVGGQSVTMLDGIGTSQAVGDSVKIYIDSFGQGVFVEQQSFGGKSFWYLTALNEEGSEAIGYVLKGKAYNMDQGLQVLTFAESPLVNGSRVKNITRRKLEDLIGTEPQVLALEMDENKRITSLETPTPYAELMENTGSDGFCEVFDFKTRNFNKDGTSFDNKIKLDRDSTRVMMVPADPATASERSYQSVDWTAFVNGKKYEVAAYHRNKDYVIPDLIVCRTADVLSGSLTYNEPVAVIAKKTTVIGEDEDVIVKYLAYSENKEIALYVNPNDEPAMDDKLSSATLEVGDVIHYSADQFGYIKTFQRYYNKNTGFTQRGSYTDFIDRPITLLETTIKKYNDKFITVPDKSGLNDYDYYMLTPYSSMSVVIVRDNGSKLSVTPGTIKDLNVEDTIVIHVVYNFVRTVVVFK